jgi:hypothetical protein
MYSHHDVLPYHWPKGNRPTDHGLKLPWTKTFPLFKVDYFRAK